MGDLAPFLDAAFQGSRVVDVGVPFFPRLVGRENKTVSRELNEASLDGDLQRIAVEHAQQQVVGNPAVELVEDDGGLALVVVPPDVLVAVGLGDDVGVRVLLRGLLGLAGAGVSPVDVDLGGGVTVAVLGLDSDESGDAPVVLDEHTGELVGNVGSLGTLLNPVGNGLEIGPVLA